MHTAVGIGRTVQDADYQRSQRDCCGLAPLRSGCQSEREDRFEVRGLAAER